MTSEIAEEINDASVTLPKAIVSGVAVNGVMGIIMVITLCFTLGNVTDILKTPTKYPFIQVFFNATNNYPATNFMTSIVIIVFVSAVISEIATASRQLWSCARDEGFPFSSFFSKASVYPRLPGYMPGGGDTDALVVRSIDDAISRSTQSPSRSLSSY